MGNVFANHQTNDSCTDLLTIPDDCLLDIFSYLSPDMMDLCSVAETCKRFRSLAQRAVGKNLFFCVSLIKPRFIVRSEKLDRGYGLNKLTEVERIFTNFGLCFGTVSIPYHHQNEDFLLSLVNSKCGDELKLLYICNYYGFSFVIPPVQLKTVFKGLQKLELCSVSIEGDKSQFKELDSLQSLHLIYVKNSSIILANWFRKLNFFWYVKEKFAMDDEQVCDSEQSLKQFATFLSRHPALKTLRLQVDKSAQNCRMSIMHAIVDSCTELEYLAFKVGRWYSCSAFRPLRALKSLRSLEVYYVSFGDFEVFDAMPNFCELIVKLCLLPDRYREHRKIEVVNLADKYGSLSYYSNQTASEMVSMILGRRDNMKKKLDWTNEVAAKYIATRIDSFSALYNALHILYNNIYFF